MKSDNRELKDSGIAGRIPCLREALKLSQKDFAAKVSAAPSNLSEIESGKVKPGLKFLLKVIDTFEVNANWLLRGKGEMFLEDEEKDTFRDFRFGEQTEDIRDLLLLFKKSPLLKITVMAFAGKFMLEYEGLIQKDIEKQRAKEAEEKAGEE
jgi:transcriptional regulator with XRE-family HTH domain